MTKPLDNDAAKGTRSDETHFTGHKFRGLNDFFWQNLEASTVYFPAPHQLNDPYDCQIDLMKAIRLAKVEGEPLSDALQERWQIFATSVTAPAATCGIFSLCAGDIRGMDERLLWAHYADNHRGVAITYEIPYKFVDTMIGFAPVTYGEGKLLAALRALDLSGRPDFKTVIEPVITNFLTTKAKQWGHEKEARFISFTPGLVRFERDWLRQICFGLNTPPADRAAVIEATKRFGYRNCRFAEVFNADGGLYELDTREVHI
ncbi:MAG: DUF2971 domain-containing protein [Aquabacterium sp.]|uniref:DUF2971 domain-containing protein n=1 Tax=Aquabacterium sp. TaxID=1872578 RepID=UPI001207486E|nr:DUF2971 domain-containing protein [Aquabacterium sp.]TAK99355.1 MAG: DUF2971 domain-containing protein [Aquabacterium sp.]